MKAVSAVGWVYLAALFVFIFAPIAASVVFSFNSDRFPSIPLGHFSLEWYRAVASDPLVGEVLAGLTGIDVGGVARTFAGTVENVIWDQIGFEEETIRRDPRSTRDPLIIGVFGGGNLL